MYKIEIELTESQLDKVLVALHMAKTEFIAEANKAQENFDSALCDKYWGVVKEYKDLTKIIYKQRDEKVVK